MDHSEIAKSGYANEHWLVDLINHKPNSTSVRSFLNHIGWDNARYTKPTAYRKGGTEKSDIGIDFWRKDNDWPDSHYISCKKIESSNHNGLGHIHKTTVESYQSKWNFDNIIKRCLEVYCGNVLYENQKGLYFEHEYYKPYKSRIKEFFKIKKIDVGQTNNDVLIHVRLGDCIDQFPDNPFVMPPEYYHKALSCIDFDKVFIITNPESVNNKFLKNFDKYDPTILGGTEIEDFRAMTSFKKIIMSQSTFSWWGAFLSTADLIFTPVPQPGDHPELINEWSSGRPDIALLVDDEDRYKFLKQNGKNEWDMVELIDIEER